MARKPKAQFHPDVAAALPVALAAMDDAPAPARRGRKARAGTPSPAMQTPGRDDTGLSGIEAGANGAALAESPRRRGPNRKPKPPAAATPVSVPENAPKRRGPKRRAPQSDAAPELVETDAPGHEAGTQPASAASTDPVPMDTASAAPGGDAQPPLPGLDAPSPAKPAAQWDRATDTVRFDWPAIERTASADGPDQGLAKLLVAARAEGANSRWPL